MPVTLQQVVGFLDTHLRLGEVPDETNAVNGLQVEAGSTIERVACAVDANESTIEEACRQGATLLLVHHGLFWPGLKPVVGPLARKLKRCFAKGLNVYSAHAPLDVHPELGNNAQLVKALGLTVEGPFGKYHGQEIGLSARCDLSLAELKARVEAAVGPARFLGRGPERIRRLGVISGGAGGFTGAAAQAGLDALLTGEGAHHTILEAEERGVHLIFGGHYRTETFGVKALAALLGEKFGLPWEFIEHDTGQ